MQANLHLGGGTVQALSRNSQSFDAASQSGPTAKYSFSLGKFHKRHLQPESHS